MVVVGSASSARPTGFEISSASRSRVPLSAEGWPLETAASGHTQPAVAEAVCRFVEQELGSASRCAVSFVDWDGFRFQDSQQALPGQPLGYEEAACVGGARLKSHVIVADMESDPLRQFSEFRLLARAHGLRSCWSTPILSQAGEVLGTFAVLHDKSGDPTSSQSDAIAKAARIVGVAIEHARSSALKARYEGLLRQAQDLSLTGTFAWRLAGDEFICSEQLYRIFMLDSNLPVTYSLLMSRVHPEDLPSLHIRLERGRIEACDIAHEFRILRPEEAVAYLRMTARAKRDPLGRWEYIGAVQDVTQHRLCEEALREAKAELAYAGRVMSLGALSASIAHEIKQPLSGIITNASTCLRMLAADPPDLVGARETAKRTLRDGNRASDITTRLRALFTKKTVSGETVDLNQLAQEALSLAIGDLHRRRVSVRSDLADQVPKVRGDRIQLHQVILNLILNAADAMESIDNRARRLHISTQVDTEGSVVVSVEDSGTGIGTHAARIFEPFYTTKNDGMGIGLSISHDIIARHGGRLWASQNEAAGATFSFSIPRARTKMCCALSVLPERRRPGASGKAQGWES